MTRTATHKAAQRDNAPAAPLGLLYRFHVSMSWRTDAGTLTTAETVKVAATSKQAIRFAVAEIKNDKRRRYAGKMDARAIMIPNQEPGQ